MKYEDRPLPFGKYKGKLICDADTRYLEWLSGEDWFKKNYADLCDLTKQELEYRKKFDIER